MKENTSLKTTAAGMVLLTLFTGCVAVNRYSYKNAPKSDVRFESAAVASVFYDALMAKKFPAQGPPNGDVTVFLSMPYTQHRITRSSANMMFNSAAAKADANHDGIICEEEARIFAAAKSP